MPWHQLAFPSRVRISPSSRSDLLLLAVAGPVDGVGRFLPTVCPSVVRQQVISDGRAGANGIIGTDIVAKSNPDGYTLLMSTGSFAINPSIYKKLPYVPLRDFAPISLVAESGGLVLVVHPSVPAGSVRELIELAQAKPGQITYGSGGVGQHASHGRGTIQHQRRARRLNHVPYKGSAPALTDVLGGHIAVMFPSTVIATPHVRSGRLRALGFTGLNRSKVLPDVPTLDEADSKGSISRWASGLSRSGRNPAADYQLSPWQRCCRAHRKHVAGACNTCAGG